MLCFVTRLFSNRCDCLIIAKTLRKQPTGFTLLEIMIVMIIMGILIAIALPSYVATVDKFRYGHAKSQMDCLKKEIISYQMEHGDFPADVTNGIPADSQCFASEDIPFESKYDYNQWDAGGNCYIGITFFGKDKQKNSPDADPMNIHNHRQSGFYKDGDDLIFSLGVFDYGCTDNGGGSFGINIASSGMQN